MISYIWDLDGTLLDSYGIIISAAREAAETAGCPDQEEEILRTVKRGSLTAYLADVSRRSGVAAAELMERYRAFSHARDDRIPLMDGAEEALRALRETGAVHYVYTHRGDSSEPILKRLGILGFFREVVTAVYGFPPKPSGAGVRYLTEKYGLSPEDTWYVGDRPIDMLCARDAGVRGMLLLPEDACVAPTGCEDRVIRSLRELERIS